MGLRNIQQQTLASDALESGVASCKVVTSVLNERGRLLRGEGTSVRDDRLVHSRLA